MKCEKFVKRGEMRILGIDPGTIRCGFAIIETTPKLRLIDAGFIKINEKDLQYQLSELIEGLDVIFGNNKIDEVAIENIFYAYNPKTVLKLAQFRGAISLRVLQLHGNFSEYTPLEVKRAVTGNGKAKKEQVAFMVKKILGIKGEIKPLDITDAIAIAITHSQRLTK
jgi:crossover junction endodeoxyribonuclease RuvC